MATAGLARLSAGTARGAGTYPVCSESCSEFGWSQVPLNHHKPAHETMFVVLIMCTLNLNPLLGKKDKIRVLRKTSGIIELNNFPVLAFLHLGWGQWK